MSCVPSPWWQSRVDDGDALVAVFAPAEVLDHDGLDVDVAEAPGAVDDAHGVVPRGADEREGIVDLACKHLLGRRDRRRPPR